MDSTILISAAAARKSHRINHCRIDGLGCGAETVPRELPPLQHRAHILAILAPRVLESGVLIVSIGTRSHLLVAGLQILLHATENFDIGVRNRRHNRA